MEATQPGKGLPDCCLGGVGIRDIRYDGQDTIVSADLADIVGRLLKPSFVDVQHRHPSPGFDHSLGHGAAQADGTSGSGDDCDFAL